MKLFLTFAVFFILNPLGKKPISANDLQLSPEIRYVAAGVKNARNQFRCAEASIEFKSSMPKRYFDEQRQSILQVPLNPHEQEQVLKQLPNTDLVTRRSARFYYRSPDLYIRTHEDPQIPQIMQSESIIVGTKYTCLLQEYDQQKGQSKKVGDQSGFYRYGFITPRIESVVDGLAKGFEIFDPRAYAYFEYPGGDPLDEIFLHLDNLPEYKGEELIQGSRCMKIEVSHRKTKVLYWIDVKHSFVLRRYEKRLVVGKDLLLEEETFVPQVQESNGIWLPATVETRQFLDPVKVEPGQSPEVDGSKVVQMHVTISNFKVNTDIPASTFVMKWPKGTNVRNGNTQTGFVADGNQINEGEQFKQDKVNAAKKADASAVPQDKPKDVQDKSGK